MPDLPHILVVYDHREIRDAATRYLERNGSRATSARDASEMDVTLCAGRFDVIVLDVMMPGEDGLSACRWLAAEGATPILLLTTAAFRRPTMFLDWPASCRAATGCPT